MSVAAQTDPSCSLRPAWAVRQARATALGKLWIALSRERIEGLVPSASAGRALLMLSDGSRLSAPPKIVDAFAEHPAGLSVALYPTTPHPAPPRLIDHPVALLSAVLAARPHGGDTDRWRQLSAELGDSVANHALALASESQRRERLGAADNSLRWAARRAAADPGFSPLALFEQAVVDGHPLHP
ncbi:MAG: hypothetical protein ACRDQX_00895 [Pseudonocardiaceae bacterium]